jgi:hypothetical protein
MLIRNREQFSIFLFGKVSIEITLKTFVIGLQFSFFRRQCDYTFKIMIFIALERVHRSALSIR